MGKPGDPTARVMITPVPAHLTTDDDQLTDAAVIGVGRYGAKAVLAVPGAGALLSASVIARLPLAMLSLALLVHAEHLTGSFALAGLVSGGYTVGLGVGGPFLGPLLAPRGRVGSVWAGRFSAGSWIAGVSWSCCWRRRSPPRSCWPRWRCCQRARLGWCWSRSQRASALPCRQSAVVCAPCYQKCCQTPRRCRPRTRSSRRRWS